MKPHFWILGSVVIFLIFAGGIGLSHRRHAPQVSPSPGLSIIPTVLISPTIAPTTTSPELVYPMINYQSRITNRDYGQYITSADSKNLPCGEPFSGYHTGDDLEVTNEELRQDVPIFAIASGTVRQVGHVNGYGGLIVIQHHVGNQTVTAYYGHVNLGKTSIKQGDNVQLDQQISILGDACSPETDGERKHLHFAIHKGSTINVRGYVQNQKDLDNWLNPLKSLEDLKAQSPEQ